MDEPPSHTLPPTEGAPETLLNRTLETAASLTQSFAPTQRICAHLNAFHVYASAPTRFVEAHHYCAHINDAVRQCLIYDSDAANARVIGVEYMITPELFATLDSEEQKLWHTHVYEVRSGMLIMPRPGAVPQAAWEVAENKEMEQVVTLYGKVWHFWQVDRGDTLPLGKPELMTSFTHVGQFPGGEQRLAEVLDERDQRLGGDWRGKKERRAGIEEPEGVPAGNADWTWRKDKLEKSVSKE